MMLLDVTQYQKRPLFISAFQGMVAKLPRDRRQYIALYLRLSTDGLCRRLGFYLPSGVELAGMAGLCERYLLAMMNNMLASFGGELMEIYRPESDLLLKEICDRALERFQTDISSGSRTGYGIYVNYINRMNAHLGLKPFRMCCRDISEWIEPDSSQIYRLYTPIDEDSGRAMLLRAATELAGKHFCSLDVGGNSIKGVVIQNGDITALKELRWHPARCRTAEEMLRPLLLALRFFRCCATFIAAGDTRLRDYVESILRSDLSGEALETAVAEMERLGWKVEPNFLFDAVVIGFPDIVVHSKIAGGETSKQKGMKEYAQDHYDEEFAKTVKLDELARAYVRQGGAVVVLNDGNAASFVISVEQAFLEDGIIDEYGMFIHTVGTELGTGFVSRAGTLQHFPLEKYQNVIDLGCTDYAEYPPEDVRSVNSLSTGIPGTAQKYICQFGLFRIAVSSLMQKDVDTFQMLIREGLLAYDEKLDRLVVPSEPVDRRGELTRRLISLLEEGHPLLRETFRTMGRALGVLIDQNRLIFPEIRPVRLLSGGLIASDRAFLELCEGLAEYNTEYQLIRLDEELVLSPLLKKMRPDQRNFNVAIGSAYIGNLALLKGGSLWK